MVGARGQLAESRLASLGSIGVHSGLAKVWALDPGNYALALRNTRSDWTAMISNTVADTASFNSS